MKHEKLIANYVGLARSCNHLMLHDLRNYHQAVAEGLSLDAHSYAYWQHRDMRDTYLRCARWEKGIQ